MVERMSISNSVWANSRLGETVCKSRRGKKGTYQYNPVNITKNG